MILPRKFSNKDWNKFAKEARSNIEMGVLIIFLGLMTILARGFAATYSIWVSLPEDPSYFVGGILILCGLHPLWIGINALSRIEKEGKMLKDFEDDL